MCVNAFFAYKQKIREKKQRINPVMQGDKTLISKPYWIFKKIH